MAASGVLSSWLMLATNWFLCWLAISRASTVLASSRVRACTSSNSREFSIAMTAWSAKVLTSSIWRSVNGHASARRIKITPIASPAWTRGTPSELDDLIREGRRIFARDCDETERAIPANHGDHQPSSVAAEPRVFDIGGGGVRVVLNVRQMEHATVTDSLGRVGLGA